METAGFQKMRRSWKGLVLASFLLALAACSDDPGGTGTGGSGDDVGGGDVVETEVGGGDTSVTADTGGETDTGVEEADTSFGFDTGVRDTSGGDDAGMEDTGPVDLGIRSVTPPRGPVSGGTQYVIDGQGFTGESVVYFGSRKAEAELVDGNLVGQTPPGVAEGPLAVKVLDAQTGEDVLQGGFTYTTSLKLDSVSPNRIPVAGGTEVTISGDGFDAETRVSFNGETAWRHTLVSEDTMRVVAPPGQAGPANVRLSNRDHTTLVNDAVTYFQPLAIDKVRPATGTTAGGTTVKLYGNGFESDMTVLFGGAPATVQSTDGNGRLATVVTPTHAAGLVDIVVQTQSGDAELAEDAFYYRSQASEFALKSVTPAVAQQSGQVDVTLLGSGLDASGLSVTFGGKPAAKVVSQGPGHAVVTVPAHMPGTVDVKISDGQGKSDTLAQAFEYVADLWVDRVMPADGKTTGGKMVTIQGEGFTNASKVLFGGIPASFTVADDKKITATAPAHSPGLVDVVVERGDIDATLKDGFTYTEKLEVFGFSPVRGSISGNTYVEIRGRGFIGDKLSVKFGTDDGKAVRALDSQTLAVRTPEHKPEAVDVTVRRGQESVKAAEQFTFFNPGARNGGAWGGPVQGAVNVSVFARGGRPIPGAYVQLSTNPNTTYSGKTNQDGLVTLSGPDVYGEQTVTAIAPKYSSTTVQNVNAENITIFLSPPPSQGPPPPGPPTATFKGTISGLNKIAEPGPDEFHMGVVFATKKSPWSREPGPGNGNVVMSDGPYTLRTRIGDLALVAIGGLYNSKTEELKPLMMGVKRFQFAAEGKVYNRDIKLDIPLKETLTFKLKSPPTIQGEKTVNQVMPYLDFGFEGVFGEVMVGEGTSKVVQVEHMPALKGQLSDVSLLTVGGTYSQDQQGRLGAPQSVAIKRNTKNISQVIEMPTLLGVADVTSPAQAQRPVNGLIKFRTGSAIKPDFWYAQVLTGMGATVWDAFVPGSATSIRFPDFPNFSQLPKEMRPQPYPGGGYQLVIMGIRHPGISYRNFTYSDLSVDKWEAFSVGTHIIRF